MAKDSPRHEAMRRAAVGNTDAQPLAHELAIQYRNIDTLIPYINNARTHSDEQVAQIAASIKEFGWTNPVLVDGDNGIIAGHGRVLAARKLEATEIPVIELQGLSEAQRRAYILADNRLAQNAGWDEDLLHLELTELGNADFDLSLLGFEPGELKDLLADEPEEGLTDPDEVPEPPAEAITQPGDLWIMGDHRLLCGDSTDAESVAYLMDGAKADMVFTDPPYGVSIVKDGMVGADFGVAKKGKYHQVEGDGTTDVAHEAIAVFRELDVPTQIVWGGNYFADQLPAGSCWIIWDKRAETGIVNTFADCEIAWTNQSSPARIYRQLWNGMIREGESEKRVHPTQKPIALAEWCFENYGDPQNILDPFLGSGTTLIAAEKTNRKCYGLEIDPIYCDVIVKRWEAFTGEKATLSGYDGTFEDLQQEREHANSSA
jgi:DNA modification methylase